MKDKIVEQVVEKFQQRSKIGIQKYGTTLDDNNSDDFLNHLQEELMDAILYIQKLKEGVILKDCSSIEVIGLNGREFAIYGVKNVRYQIEDNGKKLKIFRG